MKILIVIDMQNDFITGSLGSSQAQAIVPKVKKRILQAIDEGYEIIYTLDSHDEDYPFTLEGRDLKVEHCQIGTKGWELHPELKNLLEKCGFEIEKETHGTITFDDYFNQDECKEIEEVVLVGLCSDICVLQNALILSAIYKYATIIVDASCTAGVTEETHKMALELLKLNHIKVIDNE